MSVNFETDLETRSDIEKGKFSVNVCKNIGYSGRKKREKLHKCIFSEKKT